MQAGVSQAHAAGCIAQASLAQASNAIIIGFNVRADATARKVIQEHELDLHYYSVIYDAIDEVKKAISGLLGTEVKEQIIGLAEVREVFRSPKLGNIAGCMVADIGGDSAEIAVLSLSEVVRAQRVVGGGGALDASVMPDSN